MSSFSPNLNYDAGIRFPKDACVVIVRTEWNASIIDILESGCISVLKQNEVSYKIINVPGAFEIGFTIKQYWEKNKENHTEKPVAFIALGCVFRGDTPHFDYVCKAVTDNISLLNITLPVPSIFGVLTVDNQQQADDRTTGKHGNKGAEAAITALKMISFNLNLDKK